MPTSQNNFNIMRPKGQLRQLRCLAILRRKIMGGVTNRDLAKEFNVSIATIEVSLKAALQAGLVEKFELELLNDLVPTAIKAAKKAMDEGNADVVLEILKGAGILKKQTDKPRSPQEGEGEDLDIYIRSRKRPAGELPSHQADGETFVPRVRELPAPRDPEPSAPQSQASLRRSDDEDRVEATEGTVVDGTFLAEEIEPSHQARGSVD